MLNFLNIFVNIKKGCSLKNYIYYINSIFYSVLVCIFLILIVFLYKFFVLIIEILVIIIY